MKRSKIKRDWTMAPGTFVENSSPKFKELCVAVAYIIRNDAHMLLSGRADSTARLIVAQLAHRYGLEPKH